MTGRLGITLPLHGVSLGDHEARVREIVDLGYSDAFTMETRGLDALTPLAALAVWAPELRIGSAVTSVFTRGPAALAMSAATLCELAPGRFVLGIGASSETIATDWNAVPFERPLARVRDTLRLLRRVLAGERVNERFDSFDLRGFALERVPPVPPAIHVAALRERMLALAGREADGVMLGLLAARDVPTVLAIAKAAREAAGVAAPLDVVLRLGICVTDDEHRARRRCKRQLAAYLNVPTYAAFHAWLGRGERLAPLWDAWQRGDPAAAVDALPDELVDELYVIGSAERCRARIEAFREAGITTPIVSVMRADGDPMEAVRALAPR